MLIAAIGQPVLLACLLEWQLWSAAPVAGSHMRSASTRAPSENNKDDERHQISKLCFQGGAGMSVLSMRATCHVWPIQEFMGE